jgi:hypothetical protein
LGCGSSVTPFSLGESSPLKRGAQASAHAAIAKCRFVIVIPLYFPNRIGGYE